MFIQAATIRTGGGAKAGFWVELQTCQQKPSVRGSSQKTWNVEVGSQQIRLHAHDLFLEETE